MATPPSVKINPSSSAGDSSQGAELYDAFISRAVAEAIDENAAWYCWHASRR